MKRILPAGQFETYSYDTGGNLQNRTDFNGKTTTFTYDLMRRLLTKVPDASLNQPTISFTYNPSGQRATMTDASGTTVYNYDGRNRLSSKHAPFGTLSYTYDDGGNLLTTRSSNANGTSVDYSYDGLNRLATVKDNNLLALNGGVTTYNYDTVGNLKSYLYPNGVTTTYNYNSLNRLSSMNAATPGSTLANYAYTLGAAGNRTAVTELGGRTVNYTYDDLYRLTNETIANDTHGINGTVNYGYDPVGNRLNRTSSVAGVTTQNSSYDANDRLTSDTYDANGNTKVSTGGSYDYDFENRLITHTSSITSGFVYDGDGNRVSKTVGGVTTNYLIDTNNHTGYAQVVEELQGGAVTKQFTYGHDLISQRCTQPTANCSLSFYQYDGHGSVRLLTDASAAITDAYDYDAFGNLIFHSGTTSNDYLYSGEQFDANLGFYYLRARYMNPTNGRFISGDSYEGRRFDPATLHKYLYAEGDPVNRIDPSGQVSVTEALVVAGAIITASALIGGFLYLRYRSVPVVVSWEWRNEWIDVEGKGFLSESEIGAVKHIALETFKKAYKGFLVISYEGGGAQRKIFVEPWFGEAGRTLGTVSHVYYEGLRHTMLNILKEAGITRSRGELIEGLGRGIGATAAHELGHQAFLSYTTDTTLGPDYYDTHEVGLDGYIHFFGEKRWSTTALEKMRQVLSPAPE